MFKLINKMRKVKAFYYCFYAVWVTCVIGMMVLLGKCEGMNIP